MIEGPILVTGAAGFIGSNLVDRLLGDGLRVVGLDNFDAYYARDIKQRNLEQARKNSLFTLVEGDICDSALLERVFTEGRFRTVIHLAARAGVRPSIEDPIAYTMVNLDGTTRLLQACRANAVTRFIFASSSSVYGNNEKVPFAESDPVDEPISPYAATKKSGEVLCHAYHHLFDMDIACLRFFTVYGPRQRPEMAIHRFSHLISQGATIDQFGDGLSARDYTYVSDIVAGIVAATQRIKGYRIWNLGGSRTVELRELIQKIGKTFEIEPRVRVLQAQPGDVQQTWADVTRVRAELDWEPQVTLDEGLQKFREWYATQPQVSRKER